MTYLELIKTLKSISLSQPNVHSFVRQFDDLNREDTVYSAIILQDQQHVQAGDFINYSFYISYTDRLVENNSNEDSIISTAISIINNIANTFREIYPYEVNLSNYNIFQQRFIALCAGAYSTITISIPAALCAEDISSLDALSTTITSNGDYNFIPDGLGFDSVHVVVDVQPEVSLEEKSVTINENGQVIVTTTPGFTGMSRVNINVAVPQEGYKEGYDEGYSKGHQEGVTEGYADGVATQKSKLQDITITNNGIYDREDGYKHIVVDVPASAAAEGYTININENGTFTYTPQEGVVWNSVTVIANVPTEGGYQEGYEAGYAAGHEAGYTEGYNAGKADGKAEGIAEQKAKLDSIEITGNGTYEKEDGYNRVVVNVEHKVRLQEKTVNPATTTVVVTPQVWFNGLSKVTVNPVDSNIDPNIVPENIKTGVTILGVGGTLKEEKPEETFNIQPTTSDQTITPSEGKVFSGGTVRAVTAAIDSNIVSNNVREGVTILGVAGTLKEEKPEERFDVQPSITDQTITPSEGKVFSGGTVKAVTSNIDVNIQPENIKEGVSILGVGGTLKEGSARDYIDFSVVQSFTENGEFPLELIDGKYAGNVYIDVPTTDVFVVPDGMKFSRSSLTEFPSNLDTSNVTNMSSMFEDCSGLRKIPQLDTSKVTNMHSMFSGCPNLTTIPQLDTSNVTDMVDMFEYDSSLITISQLDTSKVTDMSYMFYRCAALTTIPPLNTSMVTNMFGMLEGCLNLATVEGIDFSGLIADLTDLFRRSDMPKLTRFIVNGKINVSISDNYSIKPLTAIDYDSVKSILAAADRTDNTNKKTLAFNRTMTDQNGELAALVSSCSTKGWTITGLTLQ